MSVADRPLVQLFLVRARELRREPGVLFWVFGFPILLAIALGIAFRNRPAEKQLVAVVENSAAVEAKRAIDAAPGLEARITPEADVRQLLSSGKAVVAVAAGASPHFTFDPQRPGSELAKLAVRDALERAHGRADQLEASETRIDAPGEGYVDFLLPGLLGMNLMSGGVWGVGWALVLMRTRKLLKRFAATPMRRSDLLLSFMLFRVVVSLVEAVFLLLFGWLAFHLAVRGSLASVAAIVVLSAFSFAGIGLLIASRAQNSQSAAGLMNLVTLPMFLLSGVFFPASNFPDWMQPFVKALPLTALNEALRAVILYGQSLAAIPLALGVLAAWGVGTFAVALKIFRWT